VRRIRDVFSDEQHFRFFPQVTVQELKVRRHKLKVLTHVDDVKNGV
jgi:hypothetical protein